jgi:hypothetical protein
MIENIQIYPEHIFFSQNFIFPDEVIQISLNAPQAALFFFPKNPTTFQIFHTLVPV